MSIISKSDWTNLGERKPIKVIVSSKVLYLRRLVDHMSGKQH